jgi:His-Xaa-Ser system radical SAM maturase HxsB
VKRRSAALKLAAGLPPFRYRRLPGTDLVVVTSDAGPSHVFCASDFEAYLRGAVAPEVAAALVPKHLSLDGDREELIQAYRVRTRHLRVGPSLHIVALTLRCNQNCAYCHSSKLGPNAPDVDMGDAAARRVVDIIAQSPSPSVHVEFQGGEPLLAWDRLRLIVEEASARLLPARDLAFTVVTNLTLMDEEKLAWLFDRRVMICTSLDGPSDLHDANRPWSTGSSHASVVRWMGRIHQEYVSRGFDPEVARVGALLTVTRATLARGREVVDEYVRQGLKAIHLRPLDPFGFARASWDRVGYTGDEFLAFYRDTLDAIIDANLRGVQLVEKAAAIFLTKILTPDDPNYMDYRSPCGAGLGQVAYNYDGRVFSCDEGRMVGEMGDDLFCLGRADESTYEDLILGETVKSLAVASLLESSPQCDACAYKPYCGVCPVYNYVAQGDLFGRMPTNERCRISMGIMDHLFRRLAADTDGRVEAILRRWTVNRSLSAAAEGG